MKSRLWLPISLILLSLLIVSGTYAFLNVYFSGTTTAKVTQSIICESVWDASGTGAQVSWDDLSFTWDLPDVPQGNSEIAVVGLINRGETDTTVEMYVSCYDIPACAVWGQDIDISYKEMSGDYCTIPGDPLPDNDGDGLVELLVPAEDHACFHMTVSFDPAATLGDYVFTISVSEWSLVP
jgi:hypothetical protein